MRVIAFVTCDYHQPGIMFAPLDWRGWEACDECQTQRVVANRRIEEFHRVTGDWPNWKPVYWNHPYENFLRRMKEGR